MPTERPPIKMNRLGKLYQTVKCPPCTVYWHCQRIAARELLFAPPRPRRAACIPCLKKWCRLNGYTFHPSVDILIPNTTP